ncbi:hypothetical protein [Azospirillum sp. B506]|uniref:hypothetical protein n=1 Tax=Azospirillum sp. B506 TaxID=137721 RepID=UPI0011DCAAEB|nr:hypothetical protein [Azospirillum sp. B506]
MMRKTITIHCGSSKNGSTAIQSHMVMDVKRLNGASISPVLLSRDIYKSDMKIEDVERCLNIGDADRGSVEEYTSSFEIPYEVYKRLRRARDYRSLRLLADVLGKKVNNIAKNFDHIIVSAEGFETSIVLKDAFFLIFLRNLAESYNVNVIFYYPNIVEHSLKSWLQWGWIEKESLSTWIRKYLQPTPAMDFFHGLEKSYWGNLLAIEDWKNFWLSQKSINFIIKENIRDTAADFYGIIGQKIPDASSAMPPQFINAGWPKALISAFPLFWEFISGDAIRYEVIRQFLIDKVATRDIIRENSYGDLVEKIRIIFSLEDGAHRDQSVDDLDEFIEKDRSIVEVVTYLSEALYYYHDLHLST